MVYKVFRALIEKKKLLFNKSLILAYLLMVKKFVFLVFSVVLFAGCDTDELDFDNIEVPPVQGTYSFPLGEVSYTMRELILDQEDVELDFQVDDDSLITLVYSDSFDYTSNNDFLQIDDITNSQAIDLTGLIPVGGPGTLDISESFTLDYNAADESDVIDSVFYETGDVTVEVTSDLEGTLDYIFTLNNFVTVVNEVPLQVSGTLNGAGNPTTATSVRSLVNHKSLISNKTFVTDFTGTLALGAGDTFSGTESLTFDITFGNQTFSIVYGKFGQDTVQVGNETLDIEFFREMGEEGLFFGNPTLTFTFENSLGIPSGIDFSGIYGSDGNGGVRTFLDGDIVETIPVVESSDINDPGSVTTTTIELNNNNSTIDNLLATSPGRIGFDVSAISNPYDVTTTNFITQTNDISAAIELRIPMEVKLENLQQSGTLSLGDGIDVSNVDSAFIRINTINEFPFSAILDLEIQDADSNALYTVTGSEVLAAPFINVNGFVTDPNGTTDDIFLSSDGIEALSVGSHILLTVTLNTPGSLNSRDIFVNILTNYRIQINVGLGGTVNIDL